MIRPLFTLALVTGASLLALPLGSCDRSDTTTPATGTPGAGERTGRAVDNAARDTGAAARDAGNTARDAARDTGAAARDTTGAATRDSNLPGMPSVTGTDTSNMSTADAAAQRLIDNARENIKENDLGKARTLLGELKQEGMYGKLSATQKANVDRLERELQAGGSGATTRP